MPVVTEKLFFPSRPSSRLDVLDVEEATGRPRLTAAEAFGLESHTGLFCAGDPVNNVDPTGEYYRLHHNGGTNYTVEVPIHYIGGTSAQHARFNEGILRNSGQYGGNHLTFSVTTPTTWQRMTFRSNDVTVRQGYGQDGPGWEERSRATWYADGGRGPDGTRVSPEFNAQHGVWHFLGFTDLYNLSTGALNSGVDASHIMGGREGSRATMEMVELVIQTGGGYVSVPGNLGLSFAGGRVWFGRQLSTGRPVYNSGAGWQLIGAFGQGVSPGGSSYMSPGFTYSSWAHGGGGGTWIHRAEIY